MTLLVETFDTIYFTIIQMSTRLIRWIIRESTELASIDNGFSSNESEMNEAVSEEVTFKTIQQILHADTQTTSQKLKSSIMYAAARNVPVYAQPTVEFDTTITSIPYGEMVMTLELRGRFARVAWGEHEGWVLRDDLADRAARVQPEFFIGQENLVDHPNTAHVRAILDDLFGLGRSEFALQAGEYVLYRLWKKGKRIVWPATRPRVPGLWHNMLKGVPGVHIGVVPKVGSIMEYMFTPDMGHLAYVEAVFPDNTITISEANYPDSGIYNERELTKEEWRELKPVFIQVT